MNKRRASPARQVRATKTRRIICEEPERRRWDNLPQDITILIFLKLDTVEILNHLQFVCSFWQKLSKDPRLFHSLLIPPKRLHIARQDIELCIGSSSLVVTPRYSYRYCSDDAYRRAKLIMEAVDRSRGELKQVHIKTQCSLQLLNYIVEHSNSLRSFRLEFTNMYHHILLANLVKKHTLLEELEFRGCLKSLSVVKEIGSSCSRLNCLRFGTDGLEYNYNIEKMQESIGHNIPQLRVLCLSGQSLTSYGLKAILDGCTQLECLDLRHCRLSELERCSIRKCRERIKQVRLPDNNDEFDYKAVSSEISDYEELSSSNESSDAHSYSDDSPPTDQFYSSSDAYYSSSSDNSFSDAHYSSSDEEFD